MKDPRYVWRAIFEEFEIGDRVRVINQGWIYSNQIGHVVEKMFAEGRWFYLLRLPEGVLEILGRSEHNPKGTAGWFKNIDLQYVGEKGKPGLLYRGSGKMAYRLKDEIAWRKKQRKGNP